MSKKAGIQRILVSEVEMCVIMFLVLVSRNNFIMSVIKNHTQLHYIYTCMSAREKGLPKMQTDFPTAMSARGEGVGSEGGQLGNQPSPLHSPV